MTFAVKITKTKKTGTHPLEGEGYEREAIIKPRAGGAILLDASIADGNSKVAMPVWVGQIFSGINSGTIGTITGGGTDMRFSATGDVYVNYVFNVQLDNTTGPYTGYFNIYFKWVWGNLDKYLGSLQLDNFNNDAWTITISGLASMWSNDLKIYMGVDNAQDTFYWWGADFQLLLPTTNFPSVLQLVPPPLFGQGGGPPPNFPPPTPPPIGAIPPGILVGPAIMTAPPPISVAGFVQPIFTFGNATTPPASAAFPEQTTTYPHPPIIINATQNTNTPVWVAPPQPPPSQTSTPPLGGSYNTGGVWGPPQGPALPPVVPTGPRPFYMEEEEPPEDEGPPDEPVEEHEPEDEPEREPSYEPHRTSRPTTRRGRGRKK